MNSFAYFSQTSYILSESTILGFLDICLRYHTGCIISFTTLHITFTLYFSMYLFGGFFYLFITFYKDLIFIAVLGSQENWEECTEVSHILLAPTHAHPPSLLTSITNRMVHFLRRINLHWHNLPPKVIIDFRVQSWGCMFCQFGQMFNDANTTVEYHTE